MGDSFSNIVQLKMLNDKDAPYEFVVELLETVFGQSASGAKIIAATAHHYGEADCGISDTHVLAAFDEMMFDGGKLNAQLLEAGSVAQ